MKTKTIIVTWLCLFCFYAWTLQATNPETRFIIEESNDNPPGYEAIILHGDLSLNAGTTAVEAGFNETSVYIQFNQNLGYVSVTVINPYGLTIYTGVVNTAVQQLVVIPVSLSAEGIYTIVLDNTSEYAEGDFEIQP